MLEQVRLVVGLRRLLPICRVEEILFWRPRHPEVQMDRAWGESHFPGVQQSGQAPTVFRTPLRQLLRQVRIARHEEQVTG